MEKYYDIFIKNGELVLPNNKIENLNIGITDNVISLITSRTDYNAKNIIDAKNLTIIPGAIDSQVHFREPGATYKEDLESGSRSAALGGITSVFEMPILLLLHLRQNYYQKNLSSQKTECGLITHFLAGQLQIIFIY